MNRRHFLQTTSLAIASVALKKPLAAEQASIQTCDLFVYGSTPEGIEAIRTGVAQLEREPHTG
jgi:hypothetical protein